jgi:hypothetical protein
MYWTTPAGGLWPDARRKRRLLPTMQFTVPWAGPGENNTAAQDRHGTPRKQSRDVSELTSAFGEPISDGLDRLERKRISRRQETTLVFADQGKRLSQEWGRACC